ncbi:superfamily I DNA/RNA helicase [Paraburkholderia sp. GAS333]
MLQWPKTADGQPPPSFCVVASSEKNRDTLELLLQKAGKRTVSISAQSNHTEKQGVVHMGTMHQAKGLEFDYVTVVAPSSYVGKQTEESNRRQLLYVALTRAKRGAILVLC